MPQRHYEDDPTLLAPILQVRLDALEEHIDQRLDRIEGQIDGLDAHVREHCRLIEAQLADHKARIEAQERQGWLRWAATALSAFLAFMGIRTPK
jgi:hypothetical protein